MSFHECCHCQVTDIVGNCPADLPTTEQAVAQGCPPVTQQFPAVPDVWRDVEWGGWHQKGGPNLWRDQPWPLRAEAKSANVSNVLGSLDCATSEFSFLLSLQGRSQVIPLCLVAWNQLRSRTSPPRREACSSLNPYDPDIPRPSQTLGSRSAACPRRACAENRLGHGGGRGCSRLGCVRRTGLRLRAEALEP